METLKQSSFEFLIIPNCEVVVIDETHYLYGRNGRVEGKINENWFVRFYDEDPKWPDWSTFSDDQITRPMPEEIPEPETYLLTA